MSAPPDQSNWNAYHPLDEPQRSKYITNGVVSGLVISFALLACCLAPAKAENGEMTTSGIIVSIVLFVPFAAGIMFASVHMARKKYAKLKEAFDEKASWQRSYWTSLDDLMRSVHESGGRALAQKDWSMYGELYRPKGNELAYWMTPAIMSSQRERVDSITRVGVINAASVPFTGLAYANVEKVVEHKVNYDHIEGDGLLIVTERRLLFVSFGHGENWSREWDDVVSWQPGTNALLVQSTHGPPKVFALKYSGQRPICDTQLAGQIMGVAHTKACA